jgi:hypothetical protein
MQTGNVDESKAHLSKLTAKAANGKPKKMRRLGFGDGKSKIPDDFDTMFEKEIEEMFCGDPDEFKYPPESKEE